MHLYDELTRRYRSADDDVLVTPEGDHWSLSRLERLAARLSAVLRGYGLEVGDRVLVQVPKSPRVIALYLACLRSGFVFVPLNTAYTSDEFDYFIQDAEPAVLVLDAEAVEPGGKSCRVIRMQPNVADNAFADADPGSSSGQADFERFLALGYGSESLDASIIYTSGTTGRSKGAVLSRSNLLANATTLNTLWGFSADDVLLHCLPVFHVHGLFIALHTAMLSGAVIRFLPAFDVDLVMTELPKCTVMMGVPTYYTRMLSDSRFGRSACQSVRLFVSGSAPLSNQTFEQFESRTGHRILERYGMSETNIIASNPLNAERVAGTVGFAVDDTIVRIADADDHPLAHDEAGSVQVKGPGVFTGYWRQPGKTRQEFTEDGFFRTGDLGRLDHEGRLTLAGRQKDLIITGGLNVYPAEIERLLNTVQGVRESAVVGKPDPDFGERVEAFIVSDGSVDDLPGVLREWVRRHMANFKRPKAFHLIETLPRNTMGKVQKNALRDRLEQ